MTGYYCTRQRRIQIGGNFIAIFLFHFLILPYMTTPTFTHPTSAHTAIIPQDTPSITLRPVQSIDIIVEAYNEYNRLKTRLLNKNDYHEVSGKVFIKKSWMKKLATAFWISVEIIREKRLDFEDYFIYECTSRAIAPSGRFADSVASCSSKERKFAHPDHDVRSIASTRSTNRSISDLIWWDVTYEEMHTPEEEVVPLIQQSQGNVENKNPESVMTQEELENSEPHMKWFVNKNNQTYETPELMTVKQKNYLIKLIEIKYPDEQTRAKLYNRLLSLTKREATSAIQKLLA